MASTQLTKTSTKNATNVCTTVLSQKQSQEIIQTMILGAVSGLAFLRRLMPDKAFEETCIPLKDELLSYEDFANGRLGNQLKSSKGQFPRMKIPLLRYGLSNRANTFLDNLAAAFQVLEVGNLNAIHFHVHEDATDRSKIIETYKLSIKYEDNSDNGKQTPMIQLDAGGNVLLDAEATNKQLARFLRKVVDLCDRLPDLPEHRHVSLAIEAVQGFIENALPAGYEPSTIHNLLLAQAAGYTRENTTIHGVSIGFHSGVLEMSHLMKTGANGQMPLPHGLAQRRLPATLTYNTDAHEAKLIVSDAANPDEVSQVVNDPAPAILNHAQRLLACEHATMAGGERVSGDMLAPRPDRTSSLHSGLAAQHRSSSITFGRPSPPTRVKKGLTAMMQSECLTQGDTQPQSQVYPHLSGDDNTDVSNEEVSTIAVPPRKELTIVLKLSKPLSNNTPAMRPSVKKSRMSHLLSRKGTNRKASRMSLRSKDEQPRNGDVVRCDCGYQEDEGAMVVCEVCGFWQHLHCYGYKGENDSRMPANHVCYRCLLGDLEYQTLGQLQHLAVQRRCVHHVLEHGVKSKAELTAATGLEPDIADQQYDWLRTHGLVSKASKLQRRGRSNAAATARHGGPIEKIVEELFNPFQHIEHHFDLPGTEAIEGANNAPKLNAQQQKSMPPPVTPAAASRRVTPTLDSDLDRHGQTVVQQTPYLPRSRTRASLKHRLQSIDQEVASPAKRRSGSASIPSQHMILQSKVIFNSTAADSSPYGP